MKIREKVPSREGSPDSRFRGDIQGLRGIAVAFVLLFHARIPGFRGGFVGVDIFFVLSGYLITGNLLREIKKTGRVRFREFYARRIRRLLPASFLVLIVTLIAAAIWLPPLLLPRIAVDISSAGLYISNLNFAARATNYFSASTIPSPVLHFWSLGVEEQFYLFWPLLMAFATIRRKHVELKIFVLGLILLISSFTYAVWLLPRNQPWAFFSIPTRAWELILGALLASAAQVVAKVPRFIAAFVGLLGFGMVLFSGLTQNDPLRFPGIPALLPTVGSLFLIFAGSIPKLTLPSLILSWKPLQQLGKISYSLYLWHWPVLVIPQIMAGGQLTLIKRISLGLLSIVLAALTEKFVERPFRRGFVITLRPLRNIGIAGLTAVLIAVLAFSVDYSATAALRNKHGLASASEQRSFIDKVLIPVTPKKVIPIRLATVDFPVPSLLQPDLLSASSDRPISYADRCHTQMNLIASTKPCIYGDITSNTTVVLFGDSHALEWFPAINQVAKENKWKLLSLTMSACSPANIPAYNPDTGSLMKNCPIWRVASIKRIITAHPYLVLIASTRGFETEKNGVVLKGARRSAVFKAGMNETISLLKSSGARVLMMSDTPVIGKDPLVCLSAHPKSTLACATPVNKAISDDWIAIETQIAKQNSIQLIKPQMWICPTDPCPVVIGNILTYFDTGHMTATFSQALAGELKVAIAKALSLGTGTT
ncbi:MAG TPA: acyltransferase family protein [Candidatus Nanopelagicaceae bacterium]